MSYTILQVGFQVRYAMSLGQYEEDIEIAVGTLSALAFVYSFMQTWGWSKRAGKIAIDFMTFVKLFLYCLGNLANVFFVVMFGASIWWLIFYKVCTLCSNFLIALILISHHANSTLEINAINLRTADLLTL